MVRGARASAGPSIFRSDVCLLYRLIGNKNLLEVGEKCAPAALAVPIYIPFKEQAGELQITPELISLGASAWRAGF